MADSGKFADTDTGVFELYEGIELNKTEVSTRIEGIKLVPNLTFIRGYATALGINTWQLAWALTSNSPLIDTY